jgi:dCTP deaminase
MTIKNDLWLLEKYEDIIKPFCSKQVRTCLDYPVISYGVSSFGYDIRLANHDIRLINGMIGINPKNPDPEAFDDVKLISDKDGVYFWMPPHSYALGVSVEYFNIPNYITVNCLGKSTYARSGIMVNITPLEAGWRGWLTIEIANLSPAEVRVYADEGIAQLQFHEGEKCLTSYSDRNGKYHEQLHEVTLSKS